MLKFFIVIFLLALDVTSGRHRADADGFDRLNVFVVDQSRAENIRQNAGEISADDVIG
jgi:hypothetical protein